jgi:hypothetical protein
VYFTHLPVKLQSLNSWATALGFAVAAAIPSFSAVAVVTHTIDQAFTLQCATQDWPAESHTVHVEYCEEHEKPVGTHTLMVMRAQVPN